MKIGISFEEVLKKRYPTKAARKKFDKACKQELIEYHLEEKLRPLRKASGLTQAQVAEKMDINQSNVSRMERVGYISHVRVGTLLRYVHTCGGDLDITIYYKED